MAIGYLVGIWLLFGAAAEFVQAGLLEGWKWLHILVGVLFAVGGVAAFMSPFQTFTVLAALIGFFLILKGTFDFVLALMVRHDVDLWWLAPLPASPRSFSGCGRWAIRVVRRRC